MKKYLLIVLFISLVLSNYNCKSNDDVDLIDQQKAEESAGLAARTVTSLIGSIYQGSSGLSYSDVKKTLKSIKGTEFDATYNESTGWWTVSFNYDGYQATLSIQLKDISGTVQKNFDDNTGTVIANGGGSGPELTFIIDWTISGTEVQSSAFNANGSGELEYKGETVSFEISEVEIIKPGLANPASGILSVEVGGIVFTLNYDGSAIVAVTYSYNGADHRIVINIHTGSITRFS